MAKKGKVNKESKETEGIKTLKNSSKKNNNQQQNNDDNISTQDDVEQSKDGHPDEIQNHKIEESKKDDGCKEKDQEIKDWKKDYDELYDKYLRLYSEFENFRRRTNKEKFDLMDRANESLIVDLLDVMDDFERALQSFNDNGIIKEVKNGVQLIYNKLKKNLDDKGVKEIDCIGKVFDPELHEAITKIPAPRKKLKGKIVDQIQKGYYLKENVIRHSKVVIGE